MVENNKKQKGPKKQFDIDSERGIMFDPGTLSLANTEREYYIGYPYQYWYHKARALWYFIEDASRLQCIRNEKDIDTDDYIIENLKMEIHMIVFHSAESLFLTVLGHLFYRHSPWFWISSCKQRKFYYFMNLWKEKGLEGIINEPEEWLRERLYPTVIDRHRDHQKAKVSVAFIKKFLDRLLTYFMDHEEYNAYKHGLRVFPDKARITDPDEATRKAAGGFKSDIFKFLTDEPIKETRNGQEVYGYRIDRNLKRYNIEFDIQLIVVITGILQNFVEGKNVQFNAPMGQKTKFHYVYFEGFTVEEIFRSDPSK